MFTFEFYENGFCNLHTKRTIETVSNLIILALTKRRKRYFLAAKAKWSSIHCRHATTLHSGLQCKITPLLVLRVRRYRLMILSTRVRRNIFRAHETCICSLLSQDIITKIVSDVRASKFLRGRISYCYSAENFLKFPPDVPQWKIYYSNADKKNESSLFFYHSFRIHNGQYFSLKLAT